MKLPENCIVREIDLPAGVRGFVSEDSDGYMNIYINARLNIEGRRSALRHEIDHINDGDIHSADSIASVERKAGGLQ